ncbi:MAG TPA: hypothetical protein VFT70_12560 [Nocardioides sp.]|nr:hypothetical protein [Nocardioides sp.]
MFTTHWRRGATDDPGAERDLSSELRAALPPRFEAVGEALASGSGTVVACEVVGGDLARDGRTLAESLDALAATSLAVLGTEPGYAESRALATAWSDTMLGYLNDLSCDDPLTGLATRHHLRSRVSEVYRAGDHEAHALVVVASPPWPDDVLTRAMHDAQVGDTVRTVFAGAETVGSVGSGRVVVLADRDDRIGRRVGLLRRMLDGGSLPRTRVWIEGLPGSDEAAGRLLDELTRA